MISVLVPWCVLFPSTHITCCIARGVECSGARPHAGLWDDTQAAGEEPIARVATGTVATLLRIMTGRRIIVRCTDTAPRRKGSEVWGVGGGNEQGRDLSLTLQASASGEEHITETHGR